MNMKEGARRLALLLGAVGTIGGCLVSYLVLRDIEHQRTRHENFVQLAASNVVKQELKNPHSIKEFDSQGNPIQIVVNRDGIKVINRDSDHIWNDFGGIYSIETTDGQTLYPTPAPSGWGYLFAAFFPLFGFLIPWGAIRAIGWVLSGFVQPSK